MKVGRSMFRRTKDQKGFSLVELMVVVAIIGILAALAVPRFQTFQAKARQSEAKTNLSHIYTLEQAYHGENTAYVAFNGVTSANCTANNPIGFKLSDCSKVRYDYSVANVTATTFLGTANNVNANRRINPSSSCSNTIDTWQIDQDKNLRVTNDASQC
jgi:prepilin-type N-terminal cleavage/methylation domain-containing protein